MEGYAASFLVKMRQVHTQCNPGSTMASTELILKKLLSTLHERFAIDTDDIDTSSRLSDIGIDSLHLVDVMLDMENEFGFRFESLLLPPNPSFQQIALAIMNDGQAPG